jgi:preprotein translocase subunit SecE
MLEKLQQLPSRTVGFYGEVKSELRKVTWPGKKEVYGTTIVVIVTVFFFGIYLFLVDSMLQVLVKWLLNSFR